MSSGRKPVITQNLFDAFLDICKIHNVNNISRGAQDTVWNDVCLALKTHIKEYLKSAKDTISDEEDKNLRLSYTNLSWKICKKKFSDFKKSYNESTFIQDYALDNKKRYDVMVQIIGKPIENLDEMSSLCSLDTDESLIEVKKTKRNVSDSDDSIIKKPKNKIVASPNIKIQKYPELIAMIEKEEELMSDFFSSLKDFFSSLKDSIEDM